MDEKKREELLKKIEEYTKKIEEEPNNASNYYNRGNAFRNLKNYNEAINDYNKAIELNSNNASYYNNRGNAFNVLREFEKAIDDYNNAIRLNPNYSLAYNNKGVSFYNLEKYDDAIANYNEAIKLNPDYVLAYNNRGNAFFYKKEYNNAIKDYTETINLKPEETSAYYNRGNAFSILGKFEKAIKDYNKAIELDPNYISAYYNRGITFNNLEKYEKAIKDCNKVIELDPTNNSVIELKKIILELRKGKKIKNIQHNNKIVDTTVNIQNLEEIIKKNKIIDITKNIKNPEEINKEDNLEPDFISDFNEVKALYLNGIFKETKKKLNLFIKKYKKDSKKERQIENLLKEVESIREFLENHQKASDGYLTFADILGWKGIWKKQNSDNEKVDTLNTLLFIKNKLEEEFKEQRKDENNDNYKIDLISDTYVIYSKELELSNKLSKRLLELCLINGLLIRGATSYGKFYNNDMVYIGQAVDEAASWHEKGEEIGIFYTSSARLSKNLSDNELEKYLLINDEVNTKIGKIKTYFINWYNDITERNFYSIMKNEVINPEYSLKYFNTENRLKKILHSEEGEKNNVKNR